jgi:hypothetical protein
MVIGPELCEQNVMQESWDRTSKLLGRATLYESIVSRTVEPFGDDLHGLDQFDPRLAQPTGVGFVMELEN